MESEGLLEEEKRLEKTTSERNRERGNGEEKERVSVVSLLVSSLQDAQSATELRCHSRGFSDTC